jgi:hypothetical protein
MTTKRSCFLFCLTLALGLSSTAFTWPLNDSETPGSVIVFHKFIAGSTATPDQGTVATTTFEISATCPKDSGGCALNQAINLRAHWVCGGVQNSGDVVCPETDFNLSLTVNGTVVFDADGNGAPRPPCRRGYLIAWVIDDSSVGNAIKFDGLIGDAVIRSSVSGARAYNALPIQAVEWLGTGQTTDGNGNGALDFDGREEYRAITGKVFGDVRYEDSRHATELTLLTLDVRSNAPNPLTTVSLNFYNENEDPISTGRNFHCWTEDKLTDIDGNLNTSFGTKGLFESTSATQDGRPVTLVGIVESEETLTLPVSVPVPGQQTSIIVPFPVPLTGIACTALANPPSCTINRTGTCSPPFFFNCNCVSATCTLTVNPQTVVGSAVGTRDYAYSLYNDANPVETTFYPTAPPPPPPD